MRKITFLSIIILLLSLSGSVTVLASEGEASNVRSINHRGYNTVAPENTLPAYILSKQNGFSYVETDISFTKDGVPVLLHDSTIKRTARNADGSTLTSDIKIGDLTYEEALSYDFGIWKGQEYKDTKIPTFQEFLNLCKTHGLHPYIELKGNGDYSQSQIESLVNSVAQSGLRGKVTWISFKYDYLVWVKNKDSNARLGYLASVQTDVPSIVNAALSLRTSTNDVFLDLYFKNLSSQMISFCKEKGVEIEVWTIDTVEQIKELDPYISGITTNMPKYEDAIIATANSPEQAESDASDRQSILATNFKTEKEDYKNDAEALRLSNDSEACKILIENAKITIDKVEYDYSKTPAQNSEILKAIVTKLINDLSSQRDMERAGNESEKTITDIFTDDNGVTKVTVTTYGQGENPITEFVYGKSDNNSLYLISVATDSKKVVVPDTVTCEGITYKVTRLRKNFLKYCKNVKKLELGKNINTLDKGSLNRGKKITSILIKSKLIKIGKGVFNPLKKCTIKLQTSNKICKNNINLIQKSGLQSGIKIKK